MPKTSLILTAILVGCAGSQAEPPLPPGDLGLDQVVEDRRVVGAGERRVDVLFVVADEEGMVEVQQRLAAGFPRFLEPFDANFEDYRIAVAAVDVPLTQAEGGLAMTAMGTQVISPATPDAAEVFTELVQLGDEGLLTVQGLDLVFGVFELLPDLFPAVDFQRPDATLHTIVVSNQDFDDSGLGLTVPEWLRWYDGLRPRLDQRSFSALLSRDRLATRFDTYASIIDAVGGVEQVFEDDESDWGEAMGALAEALVVQTREVFLSQRPVVDTIEVTVERNDEAVAGVEDWTYDALRNALVIHERLDRPHTVVVRYRPEVVGVPPNE